MDQNIGQPRWFRPVDAARYLGISRQRVNTLLRQGRFGRPIGGYTVISQSELDRYKRERERRSRRRKGTGTTTPQASPQPPG